MKLQKLHIKNFKSIVDLDIVEPNPFTVFVGPNGSGKSNIFEALELVNLIGNMSQYKIEDILGGKESYLPFNSSIDKVEMSFKYEGNVYSYEFPEVPVTTTVNRIFTPAPTLTPTPVSETENSKANSTTKALNNNSISFAKWIVLNFIRLRSSISIVSNKRGNEQKNYQSSEKLDSLASNLEMVLKRILQDKIKSEEILDWLGLFIPEFERIEIKSEEINGEAKLKIYEKNTKRAFHKHLISDGTYNILTLLTAVYQSDEPQFLCIEEPENGLHPQVIKELVHFFRDACEEKGHYIWLNTHSQTLVSQLQPEEIILVNKKKGETIIKQLKNHNMHGLRMDEAWLTAALGGGLPW